MKFEVLKCGRTDIKFTQQTLKELNGIIDSDVIVKAALKAIEKRS